MEVTKGMKVIACEAINFNGAIEDVPTYAIDAVITAKSIYANKTGREPNLNFCFPEILDITVAVLKQRGQIPQEEPNNG